MTLLLPLLSRRILFGAILLFASCVMANAQIDMSFGSQSSWYQGMVVLRNGEKRIGSVSHNEALGMINFREDDDDEIESFSERKVQELRYFHTGLNRELHYYSFEYRDLQRDREEYLLFQILKDYKDFAVLARKTRLMAVGQQSTYTGTTIPTANRNRIIYG